MAWAVVYRCEVGVVVRVDAESQAFSVAAQVIYFVSSRLAADVADAVISIEDTQT